jgi:protein transport protein SEC61 subunit gamma-like protein
MDQVMTFVEPGRQFAKDSLRLVKRCTKPDRKGKNVFSVHSTCLQFNFPLQIAGHFRTSSKSNVFFCLLEFQKIAMATAIGFAIMGFIGFFVKLIHIPINNIIVGS